jgi:tetratricopeptide (TPR) repeat protein
MFERAETLNAITNTGDILLSAKAKYKSGNYQESVIEYTLAIQFAPSVALAFCGRGDAYCKLGKLELAMTDYNRAVVLDPEMVVPYYRRGNLHFSFKDYVLATTEYSRAIELKPDFALAYIGRGYASRELYGEREGVSDWRLAAQLFQEQQNLEQYRYTMNLIELNTSLDTLSGMLE